MRSIIGQQGFWNSNFAAGNMGIRNQCLRVGGIGTKSNFGCWYKKRLKLLFVILIAQSPVDNEYSKIWRDARQCIAILNCNPFRIRKSKPRLQTRSHVSYDKFWHGTIAARSGILWEKLWVRKHRNHRTNALLDSLQLDKPSLRHENIKASSWCLRYWKGICPLTYKIFSLFVTRGISKLKPTLFFFWGGGVIIVE
jgi:hypothetical protein